MTNEKNSQPQTPPSPAPKKENSLYNILFNIVIPVFILNKADKFLGLGAHASLLIALAFPVIYWIYDFVTRKKFNYISLLGFLNILFTGGLAMYKISGFWFAVKEATFPTLIGIFVLVSAFTKNPFIKTLLFDPHIVNLKILDDALVRNNAQKTFADLLKRTTLWLSASFALSAVLNFFLARYIFKEIDPTLSEENASVLLNSQIADMTTWSFPVIMVPSILFLGGIFYFLFKEIRKITGLKMEEILHH